MNRTSIKTTAEAALRELPSVLGAYVSEDLEGNPREVHLLVRSGPDTASLARDLRGMLQERLGIPIDQRVISIAQLADEAPGVAADDDSDEPGAGPDGVEERRREAGRPDPRVRFGGLESTVSSGQVTVVVELEWQDSHTRGTAHAAETAHGRARAAANATLEAAMALAEAGELRLELDFSTTVQALDGDYALVSVLGASRQAGRRALPLVAAHPVEGDVESATAFATLKAVNRVLGAALPTA